MEADQIPTMEWRNGEKNWFRPVFEMLEPFTRNLINDSAEQRHINLLERYPPEVVIRRLQLERLHRDSIVNPFVCNISGHHATLDQVYILDSIIKNTLTERLIKRGIVPHQNRYQMVIQYFNDLHPRDQATWSFITTENQLRDDVLPWLGTTGLNSYHNQTYQLSRMIDELNESGIELKITNRPRDCEDGGRRRKKAMSKLSIHKKNKTKKHKSNKKNKKRKPNNSKKRKQV